MWWRPITWSTGLPARIVCYQWIHPWWLFVLCLMCNDFFGCMCTSFCPNQYSVSSRNSVPEHVPVKRLVQATTAAAGRPSRSPTKARPQEESPVSSKLDVTSDKSSFLLLGQVGNCFPLPSWCRLYTSIYLVYSRPNCWSLLLWSDVRNSSSSLSRLKVIREWLFLFCGGNLSTLKFQVLLNTLCWCVLISYLNLSSHLPMAICGSWYCRTIFIRDLVQVTKFHVCLYH